MAIIYNIEDYRKIKQSVRNKKVSNDIRRYVFNPIQWYISSKEKEEEK